MVDGVVDPVEVPVELTELVIVELVVPVVV